jgi:hypothetical protein
MSVHASYFSVGKCLKGFAQHASIIIYVLTLDPYKSLVSCEHILQPILQPTHAAYTWEKLLFSISAHTAMDIIKLTTSM